MKKDGLVPWVVAKVLQGYLRHGGFLLRSVGSHPQAKLTSPEHQSWKRCPHNIWL